MSGFVSFSQGDFGLSLKADTIPFNSNSNSNTLLVALSQPYGNTTTYAAVAPVPAQLTVINNGVYTTGSTPVANTSYVLRVQATSGDSTRSIIETFNFLAMGTAAINSGTTNFSSAAQSGLVTLFIGEL